MSSLADSARGDERIVKDIAYKSGPALTEYEQQRCKLDLYLPAGSNFTTVVWFYGGGLESGDKARPFSVHWAQTMVQHGIAVAIVDYRLSPQAKFPAYVDDAAAAVAWTLGHIAEYGGDPKHVFIAGHSAGAYLATLIGYDAKYLEKYSVQTESIAGLIPISPQVFTHFTVRNERGVPNPRATPTIDDAAPCYYARPDAPPTLILVGGKDLPTREEECAYFVAQLKSLKHPDVQMHVIANRDHGSTVTKMSQPDDPALEIVLQFIASHVTDAPSKTPNPS